jgi:NAD(P)-dependent dehydrogenase (short-subunit alcohol dehydrogenase family)
MSEQTLALVTGANQGIGYEIAAGLGALGWSIGVGDRNAERQQDAVAKLRADGVDAFPVPIDVTDDASVAAAAHQIEEQAGRLDVLVNNAGGGPPGELAGAAPRLIERIILLNLTAPLWCAQAANRIMQQQGEGGCIINIGSVAGERPSPDAAAYGAAKAGLLHATTSLAMEFGPRVRVNGLITGFVATPNAAEHYGGAAGVARISAAFPLKRLAEPADIAAACLYLASPLAAYVSGALLAVHGGGERPLFLHLAKGEP